MASSTVARATCGRIVSMVCVALIAAGCASTDPAPPDQEMTDALAAVVEDAMTQKHLRGAIVRVTVDGKPLISQAFGESMTNVPATADMHFRNGAVAISYVSTLLLILVDEQKVQLEDSLSTWLPDIPHSERVTLGQLAQMTSGYPDYVPTDEFTTAFFEDPFRQWSTDELLALVVSQPLHYPPGTNWNYSHTNYVLLGLALEKATGQDMSTLLREKVLDPLELSNTRNFDTPEIPEPVLHAFSSERRPFFEIGTGTPFYEESTFWNPSWTITRGAIQTTNISDLEATAAAIGSGKLLSPESHRAMVSPSLRGHTRPQPGCQTCGAMTEFYTYGLGIVISGNWLLQNPLFGGYSAVGAYLPAQKISIAVAVTYQDAAFDADGNYANEADGLFRRIGATIAPDDAPPLRPAT